MLAAEQDTILEIQKQQVRFIRLIFADRERPCCDESASVSISFLCLSLLSILDMCSIMPFFMFWRSQSAHARA
jgi:hypothetical protein